MGEQEDEKIPAVNNYEDQITALESNIEDCKQAYESLSSKSPDQPSPTPSSCPRTECPAPKPAACPIQPTPKCPEQEPCPQCSFHDDAGISPAGPTECPNLMVDVFVPFVLLMSLIFYFNNYCFASKNPVRRES